MIGVAPPLPAHRAPVTDPAVLHRLGLGLHHASQEGRAQPAKIGLEIGAAERLLAAVAEQQAHRPRRPSKCPGQEVRVDTQLDQGARLGVQRQLGVHDLVGPCTQAAGLVDPHQEVRPPEPLCIDEGTLVDQAHPAPHRLRGVGGCALPVEALATALEADEVAARLQDLQLARLVLDAPLRQRVRERITKHGLCDLARGLAPRQLGQVPTGVVVRQRRRRVALRHRTTPAPSSPATSARSARQPALPRGVCASAASSARAVATQRSSASPGLASSASRR